MSRQVRYQISDTQFITSGMGPSWISKTGDLHSTLYIGNTPVCEFEGDADRKLGDAFFDAFLVVFHSKARNKELDIRPFLPTRKSEEG